MERDHRRRVPGICFLTKATLNINVRLGASLHSHWTWEVYHGERLPSLSVNTANEVAAVGGNI